MGFKEIRDHCLRNRILYEDQQFEAVDKSIYFSKVKKHIVWKRPRELVANPKFVVRGKTRFDLYQGNIGNCWYIVAAATIATRPELFSRIIPEDQSFDTDYAGIFHFSFWRFGEWKEVIIDDRLPTYKGRNLMFCHNKEEPNEFWTALLEKAYAKLHGSYEALDGGWVEDALVDFTGGVGERKDLRKKQEVEKGFFQRILHDCSMNSLMGCSILATEETMERIQPNGLVIGHAYSLTKAVHVTDIRGNGHRLLRLRNPWGNIEWNGAWSDKSKTWEVIDQHKKRKLRFDDNNGEFWQTLRRNNKGYFKVYLSMDIARLIVPQRYRMSYEDWLNNFDQMQMCHLPPENRLRDRQVWKETVFHGEWVRGVSAGGSGSSSDRDLFWTNPQYVLTLKDHPQSEKKCPLIVSLMQKYSRLKRTLENTDFANKAMSFDIYQVRSDVPVMLDGENLSKHGLHLARRSGRYQYNREVSGEYKLEPGNYIIIPSLYTASEEAKFLLRCYTEQDAEGLEIDIETERIEDKPSSTGYIIDAFRRHSGADKVIDARELCNLLNECFQKELKDGHEFDLESCRCMLTMMDENKSGVLELPEVLKMWKELNVWRTAFTDFDKDKSQSIDFYELRKVFSAVGFSLSKKVLSGIVRRYGGRDGKLTFNDFVIVLTKVMVHMDVFTSHNKSGGLKGKAKFKLEDYMMNALYF